MSLQIVASGGEERAQVRMRGRRLQHITIGYNSLEGLAAIGAGILAGSVALVGFGLDSVIEVTSGAAALWRLHADVDEERREWAERVTLRVIGGCFLALAMYVGYDASAALFRHEPPAVSIFGLVIAALSLVVMPLLSRAKRRVAVELNSAAMAADATQTDFCVYLSAILLGGLLLNATLGWWWADPAAALVMVPIIVREGLQGLRGEACCTPEAEAEDTCCTGCGEEQTVAPRQE